MEITGVTMHSSSHSIIRLPIHLPGQKNVTFLKGHENVALQGLHTTMQLMAFLL